MVTTYQRDHNKTVRAGWKQLQLSVSRTVSQEDSKQSYSVDLCTAGETLVLTLALNNEKLTTINSLRLQC
jgi:hypothetical protein